MYDLDKTQAWLNRTLQVSKAPPVRGGRSSEPHGRRHTGLSVAATALVIALGMLLMSWTRVGTRGPGGPNVVEIAGGTRVADLPPARTTPSPASGVQWPTAPRSATPASRAGWMPLTLDGNVVPLPGHTAPPAPVWLDGAPRAGR